MKIKINVQSLRDKGILVFGDENFKGTCPKENLASQTLVNQTKLRYPNTVFMHVKNEGKRTRQQMDFDNTMGFRKGASDYLFIGYPMMALEIKQENHRNSTIDTEQIRFLEDVIKSGGIGAVALGGKASVEAMEYFQQAQKNHTARR